MDQYPASGAHVRVEGVPRPEYGFAPTPRRLKPTRESVTKRVGSFGSRFAWSTRYGRVALLTTKPRPMLRAIPWRVLVGAPSVNPPGSQERATHRRVPGVPKRRNPARRRGHVVGSSVSALRSFAWLVGPCRL